MRGETRSVRSDAMEDAFLALRRTMAAMRGRFHRALQDEGLTFPQWVVLKSVRKAGRLNVRDAAGALDCSPANATGIVDRLERDGLVTRSRSDQDRRVVFVRLTERGHEKVDRMVKLAPAALRSMFEGWTEKDFVELRSVLERLRFGPDDAQDF